MTDIEKDFCETIWRFFQSINFKSKYDELFIKTNFQLAFDYLYYNISVEDPDKYTERQMVSFFNAFDDYVYNDDWGGYRMTRIFELYNGKYCTIDIRSGRYEIIELEKRQVTHYVYEIKEKPLLN